MRCSDFHDRVNYLLDERSDLSQDTAIRKHANACEDCLRDLRNYELLTTRGASTFVNKKPANQFRARMFWLTIAATLFLAVSYFPGSERPSQTAQTSPVIAPAVVSHEDAGLTPIDPTLHPVDAGTEDRVVVSGHFVQPILSIGYIAKADWSSVEPMEMPFGVSVPTVEAEWIDVVADEMLPIQQSVNSTFDLIVRTLSASA